MTRLILIRHGESIANAKGIRQGQKIDTPLTTLGKIQAKKIAERLKEENITKIFSSDLKRAHHTAKEISKKLGKKILLDKKLREKDHDNERLEDFVSRCQNFLNKIEKKKGTFVVVSHGGTIRSILAVSTGDRKKGAEVFKMAKQDNAGISEMIYENGEWSIKKINDVSHLNALKIKRKRSKNKK